MNVLTVQVRNIFQIRKTTMKPKSTVNFPLFNNKPSSQPFNIGKGEKTPLNLPESVSEDYLKLTLMPLLHATCIYFKCLYFILYTRLT